MPARRLLTALVIARGAAQQRYAYATLISGSLDYLPGVETLLCSITRARKKAEKMHIAWLQVGEPDFVAMVTKDLDVQAIRKRIEGIPYGGTTIVRPVADVAGPTFEGSERFRHTYAKLHVFNLTAYERVVFVDADAVVLRDVGALFLLDRARWCAAAPDHGMRLQRDPVAKFNTGVLSVAPSAERFATLLARLKRFELTSGHAAACVEFRQ